MKKFYILFVICISFSLQSFSQNIDPGVICCNQTICKNDLSALIRGTEVQNGNDEISYQWQYSTDIIDWFNLQGETEVNYQPDILTEATYFRRKVTIGTDEAYSNVVVIDFEKIVEPPAVIYDNVYCRNSQYVISCKDSNIEVLWYNSDFST